MSTDEPAVPRTRAEMRAAREAAARSAEAAAAAPWSLSEGGGEAAEPRSLSEDGGADRDETRQVPQNFEPEAPSTGVPVDEERFVSPAARSTTGEGPAAHSTTGEGPAARSTTDRKAPTPPRDRRFLVALGAVLGILVLVGAGLGVVSLTQGPRITEVQVNPEQAIETSGSRVILTTNQSLAAIDDSQVTVEPAVPFTLDAAGRGVGIRFTVPLDDDTEYTVRVADATGAGGGPSATLSTSFTTPASKIFLLNRDADGDDKIFRTDLTGEKAEPVFAADKINDFRATSTQLVVSVEEDEGSKLLVMKRDGSDQRELKLPGDGYVGAIQVSDRGGYVGYSYSDRELSDTEGRASVLVTQSLSGDDDPVVTEVGGEEANIFVWQFVPDSSAVLFIDFDGALSLIDRSSDAGVQSLGLATTIQGISRGTYTAIVERLDGTVVELNLTDGSEQPLAASNPDYGTATTITPYPGGTLRHVVARDANGIPSGQAIITVDDEGTATPLVEVGPTDSILQACASPSGQYAAVVIAPDLTDNPYDQMLLPLPENMETHLIDLRTGDELVALTGFDASWCQTAPQF
ncbi:Ig-like domain-containing protein [Microbacterium hydrocarbonoxydans]|uniref:Ig-like domain-containing protein n=1 Tax=Microbacterium hydrocarbonoxydans TaxID=273678 RepID=UPI00203F7436|nr:Ig-like domain-containing protein [Microbacterium hydrocarbonoxydans]MCM3778829.1 Ig-like domain-containing protein [Microbacterium hydrocarbonoxydans]